MRGRGGVRGRVKGCVKGGESIQKVCSKISNVSKGGVSVVYQRVRVHRLPNSGTGSIFGRTRVASKWGYASWSDPPPSVRARHECMGEPKVTAGESQGNGSEGGG